jgi:hypothetical protein
LSFIIDIGVVNFGLQGYDWCLEREVVELKLNLELSSLEWGLFGTGDVDFPKIIVFSNDVVAS